MSGKWWSAHTHSIYSSLDSIAPVHSIVEKASQLGHPALGLTDHGNMAGTVQAYKACKAAGMAFFPGVEAYLIDPDCTNWESPKRGEKVGRYHVGLLALDTRGYQALVEFVSMTHTRPRFNRFARCTLDDLATLGAEHGAHIALTTGCFFGLVQQGLVTDGVSKAERTIKMYATWFPNTFVEMQNHDIDHGEQGHADQFSHDNDIVDELRWIANRLGLPTIITQDSHYLDKTERKAHQMMKRMVYGGEEDGFPGDYYHVPHQAFVRKHYSQEQWDVGIAGLDHLLSLNKVTIPPLDNYSIHVPTVVAKNPQRKLQAMVKQALIDQGLDKPKYRERADMELDVIGHLGMANYFHMWDRIVRWCHAKSICIEARGSANGSLVAFLLGITQVDPLVWGTTFDRFLSKDRTKPPDIDMDVESKHRGRVVAFVQRTWPGATPIGTWSKLGTNEDGTGSVLVSYKAYRAKEAEAANGKEAKQRVYAVLQSLEDVEREYGTKDYEALEALAVVGNDVAGGKYGVYKSYGVHASGVLLSGDSVKIEEWIPTMLVASSDTTVTQFDQDDVEAFGLMKDDLLGQESLTVMRMCQELIGRKDPTDFSWIPNDDPTACKLLREGRLDTGIFHYEGYTKSKGGREMGIRSTKDAVLGQALFMPGAMNSGQKDLYIARRKSAEERAKVVYTHPIFETVLKDTHGCFIYQEQVINIMRGLGMPLASVNAFFKIVKDSGAGALTRNAERIAPLKKEYDACCKKHGIPQKTADKEWESLASFVAYGFNKAHAAGYGIRSYRTAYLKAHHPLEYMTALLQAWAGRDKEKLYARECRRISIRLLPPDVNVSGPIWTLDRRAKAIRKGLLSIPGIGPNIAPLIASHAPYTSFDDLATRSNISGAKPWLTERRLAGQMKALDDVGALDALDRET
jgi:DNA polymerase-3 subunit alpha